jgi:hypothetical protein
VNGFGGRARLKGTLTELLSGVTQAFAHIDVAQGQMHRKPPVTLWGAEVSVKS